MITYAYYTCCLLLHFSLEVQAIRKSNKHQFGVKFCQELNAMVKENSSASSNFPASSKHDILNI